MPIYLDDADVI